MKEKDNSYLARFRVSIVFQEDERGNIAEEGVTLICGLKTTAFLFTAAAMSEVNSSPEGGMAVFTRCQQVNHVMVINIVVSHDAKVNENREAVVEHLRTIAKRLLNHEEKYNKDDWHDEETWSDYFKLYQRGENAQFLIFSNYHPDETRRPLVNVNDEKMFITYGQLIYDLLKDAEESTKSLLLIEPFAYYQSNFIRDYDVNSVYYGQSIRSQFKGIRSGLVLFTDNQQLIAEAYKRMQEIQRNTYGGLN